MFFYIIEATRTIHGVERKEDVFSGKQLFNKMDIGEGAFYSLHNSLLSVKLGKQLSSDLHSRAKSKDPQEYRTAKKICTVLMWQCMLVHSCSQHVKNSIHIYGFHQYVCIFANITNSHWKQIKCTTMKIYPEKICIIMMGGA